VPHSTKTNRRLLFGTSPSRTLKQADHESRRGSGQQTATTIGLKRGRFGVKHAGRSWARISWLQCKSGHIKLSKSAVSGLAVISPCPIPRGQLLAQTALTSCPLLRHFLMVWCVSLPVKACLLSWCRDNMLVPLHASTCHNPYRLSFLRQGMS
jgi:hypothetical protein